MGVMLLVCGGIIGSSVTIAILFDRLMTTIHEPEKIPPRIVSRMRWVYGLDDEQAERIEAIYMELQRELVRIRDRSLPEIDAAIEAARLEVMGALTPEQAAIYAEKFDQFRKTMVPERARP
ncbi:MAG: hypothetical protein RLZZ303_2013 [Candidatus Hydrogenedentota bacterium]|jgi:hypothetical protein